MTAETPGAIDSTLDDGLSTNYVLAVIAVFGLLGWASTQYVAWNPGLLLEIVGVEGTRVVILGWFVATVAIAGVLFSRGARTITYSPPLWLWGVLVAIAMTANAAVVAGVVPEPMTRYALWHPWIAVYAIGYVLTGTVAVGRSRIAYLTGGLLAMITFMAWLTFPLESRSWVFALTGLVHAGPLVADVILAPAAETTHDGAATPASIDHSPTNTEENP